MDLKLRLSLKDKLDKLDTSDKVENVNLKLFFGKGENRNYFFRPLRNVSFKTPEKLTDFEDSLIFFACISCNFFRRSSSSTIVIRLPM